jgi:hypothetical protein
MVGEDTTVIVGVVLSAEEFLGYSAAVKADECRTGGEGRFAATFRSLGGEGVRRLVHMRMFCGNSLIPHRRPASSKSSMSW